MTHDNLDLAAILREHGYRMTPQRQLVLDALCEADSHATPEQVFELVRGRSSAVNRATVYRTLKFLQRLGLILDTTLPDGHVQYEINRPQPHHHLVCRECGEDIEIADDVYAQFVRGLEEVYSFQVEATHLTLQGRCPSCQT